MTFFISLILGLGVMFMLIQGVRAGQNRRLAKSYLWACLGAGGLHLFLTILFAVNIGTFSFFQTIVLVTFFMSETITIMCIWLNEKEKCDEISFKNILLKGFESKKDLAYQQLTAKKFANLKKLQYVSKIGVQELIKRADTGESDNSCGFNVQRVIAGKNNHVLFVPMYDANGETAWTEWYGEFVLDKKIVQYSRILTNRESFECITNLKEILAQIIDFYIDSLDDEWFINPYGFALELEENVVPEYTGKARLVVTDNAVINDVVEVDQKSYYKKAMLSMFLENFIGANFMKITTEDDHLERMISKLEEYARDKKML